MFAKMTPSQKVQLIKGWSVDSTPLRVELRSGEELPVQFQGAAIEAATADVLTGKATLVVARHYTNGNLLVLSISDIAELSPLRLYPTNPDSPEYAEERKVSRPIPSTSARKTGGKNRHGQEEL